MIKLIKSATNWAAGGWAGRYCELPDMNFKPFHVNVPFP